MNFKAIRISALRYALSRGWDFHTSEDFAQEYCLAMWLEKYPSLKIQLVNFLRLEYGRTDKWGSIQDRMKAKAMHSMKPFDEELHSDTLEES